MANTATFQNSLRASLSPLSSSRFQDQYSSSPNTSSKSNGISVTSIEPSDGSAIECDYDIAPTELYEAIEAQQWEHVLNLLKSSGANSDAATQAATWVLRKEKNGKLRWRLLPIHAAVIFRSPITIVEKLLSLHPPGVRCKDDQGMLPIHLAFRNNAPNAVLEALLSAHPLGINVKDRKGRIPIQCALSSNAEEGNKSRASLLQMYATLSVESERSTILSESHTSYERKIHAFKSDHDNSVGLEKARIIQREVQDSQKIKVLTATLDKCTKEVTTLQTDLSAREEEVESLTNKVSELTAALEESSVALSEAETKFEKDTEALTKERDDLLSRVDGLSVSHSIVVSDLGVLKREKTHDLEKEKALEESIEKLHENNILLGEERDILENKLGGLHGFIRTLVADVDQLRELVLKQERDMKAAAIVHQRMLNAAAKSESELQEKAEKERTLMKQILSEKKLSLESMLLCTEVKKEETPTVALETSVSKKPVLTE